MTDIVLIADSRNKFKINTFSDYKKKEVSKKLQNAIYYNKQEEASFWTAEMLCSNMLLELWDSYFILMSKYIHIHNPKLPLYIIKKYEEFRNIIGTDDNILNVRNNPKIRIVFFSITLVLCDSPKLTILDDLKHVFVFKIETLYNNLKAPNIDFIKTVYKNNDPKEYLIPFNELIYHVTVTKNKVDIVYWINWIIEYDILCRKKQKTILCESRNIFSSSRKVLEGNIIWIIWDVILKSSSKLASETMQSIVYSIFQLFSTRYTLTINKKRTFMIYHAIEIILLHKDVKCNIPVVTQTNIFNNLENNISIIFEQIKEKEIIEKTFQNNSKMDIYNNIYMTL
jgi:hypothetical protein